MIYLGAGATDTDKPFVLYDNLLAGGVLSGSAALAAGADYKNVLGPQTFDFWQAAVASGQLICTFAAPVLMDCAFFAAHNLDQIGVNWNIHTSPDLIAAYSAAFVFSSASLAANGGAAIGAIFASRMVQRIRFLPSAGGAVLPKVGIAFAGNRLIFPGAVQSPYVAMSEAGKIELAVNQSLGGHYLGGTIQRQGKEQDVQFSPLSRSFADGGLLAFAKQYNEGAPFFWGASPALIPNDIGYCWRGGGGELRPALGPGGRFASVKMGLAGYGA